MAKAEKVTWAEVCQQVRLGDTLYSTCRDKVEDFRGYPSLAEPPQMPQEDFSAAIKRTAVPIPEPPPADWQGPPAPAGIQGSSLAEQFMEGPLPAKLLWGAVGALVLLLLLGKRKEGETPAETA